MRALERVGLNAFIDEIFCFTELGRKKASPSFGMRCSPDSARRRTSWS